MAFALSSEQLDTLTCQAKRVPVEQRSTFLHCIADQLNNNCFTDREFHQAVTNALDVVGVKFEERQFDGS